MQPDLARPAGLYKGTIAGPDGRSQVNLPVLQAARKACLGSQLHAGFSKAHQAVSDAHCLAVGQCLGTLCKSEATQESGTETFVNAAGPGHLAPL